MVRFLTKWEEIIGNVTVLKKTRQGAGGTGRTERQDRIWD